MKLKDIRKEIGITQKQAAKLIGVSRRTYLRYENESGLEDNRQYKYMCQVLSEFGKIDEESGVLSIEKIKDICSKVFMKYDVEFCYLFGSYAKGKATETSDVDLLVNGSIKSFEFYELIETLREELRKKVDLLNTNQLYKNQVLLEEILKDGVKIYG